MIRVTPEIREATRKIVSDLLVKSIDPNNKLL
jgi:hypothetical protein